MIVSLVMTMMFEIVLRSSFEYERIVADVRFGEFFSLISTRPRIGRRVGIFDQFSGTVGTCRAGRLVHDGIQIDPFESVYNAVLFFVYQIRQRYDFVRGEKCSTWLGKNGGGVHFEAGLVHGGLSGGRLIRVEIIAIEEASPCFGRQLGSKNFRQIVEIDDAHHTWHPFAVLTFVVDVKRNDGHGRGKGHNADGDAVVDAQEG